MADKSKDTGTGGINVDGNVYTPDVGVPDAKGGAQGNYSSGDIAVDKTVKDISTPTRETFAKYLSKTTLGTAGSSPHKNVYPVGAGAQTQVEEIKLKDTQGNPVSPGPQNNEAKFNAGFNQQISSNNPAGLRRGAATGTGPDGNALLPNAAIAAASGGSYIKPAGALNAPIAAYTNTTVEPNLYDYDSVKVGIADGTLNASPTQVRDIKALPASSDVGTDGGTSKNILGTDGPDGNYTLTAIEARALAGATTAKNKFPIDSVPTLVTFRDAGGNPVSVTAAQNNVTNAKFFTKLIEETGEGDQTVQTISVRKLSSYTDALIPATNNLVIKRGKTENANGIDGNDLLLTIAPETAGVASLTAGAKKYTDNVVEPNLFDFTTLKVIIGDGANILATNIRPYQKTKDFATDKGTSVNVFNPDKSTSVETAAELIKTKTVGNVYSVDSPIKSDKTLNVVKLDSTAVLANSKNTNIFGSINIGSSTVISKGKLVASGLPDGNKLLANIAPLNATTGKAILTTAAKTYITAVLEPNLHNYDTSPIGLSAGSIGESPTNPREDLKYIPADSSISVDGGKSINILGPDAALGTDYTLTLIDRASYAETITKTNFFKVDAPSIVAGVLIPKKIVLSTPLSVTDAQNNPFASFFFTKETQTINGVKKVVSKLESSYTDALAASRGATDKFIIKRGKTENANGIDGNALLSTIAPKINDKVTLTPGAKTYITAVLEPNLNDIYNPKTESGVVIPEYENDGAPSGIKDLNKTSTFALDAGTSKTILSGERKLSLENAAAVPSIKTKDNFYPVDSLKINIINDKPVATLTIINTSVGTLAKTNNTNYFANIAIGSNATINSKGKLKNQGAANKDLPNGNTLLPLASTTGSAGGNYVKFVTSNIDGKEGLQQPIKTYTDNVVEPNLYDYNTLPIGLSAGSIGELPTNSREDLKYIPPDASISVDGGSSTNILGPGGGGKDYTLTLIDRATQASIVTDNNSFKVDLPNIETVNGINTLKPKKLTGITPDSVTDAQNHPFASSFFTKGIQIIDNDSIVVSKLESSYSNTFIDASKINNQNPLAQFSIKRGKVAGVGETGNELLPLATIPAIVSDRHIKFTALNANVSNYTTVLLKKNLYSINDKIKIGNLQNSDFFGLPRLYKPESGLNDAGTFDNIQKDPSKRAITQASLFKHVIGIVYGKNAPGNIGNVYKLSNLSSKDLFSFTTPEGVPASPTAAQNNIVSLAQYVLPAGTGGAKFVKLQPSYSNATENLEIRRGKSIRDERPDGNTLLKDAAAAGPAGSYIKKSGDVSPTISKYVGAVLGENRYSPQDRQQFVPSDTPGAEGKTIDGADPSPGGQRFENISDKGAPETSFVGRTTLYAPSQLKFGESPQSMVNRGEPPTGYTFRRLTRIGTILQLRAAGEATFLMGDQNDDPRSQDHQFAAALAPGAGQAGAGIPLPRELLNVTEIIKNLPDLDEKKIEAYEDELIDFNTSFEGVVNTALEKFSGFTSFGLSILSIVLVAVIVVVFMGLSSLLGFSAALDRTLVHPAGVAMADSHGRHAMGSFQGATMGGGTNLIADLARAITSLPPSAATALFGISPTYNREYSSAVQRGALAFFGVGSMPPALLSFPGQVIVTARAIIRGVAQLVKAFMDIVSAFTSGNIMAAIFNLIGIIETIRNSRVIKALNTFSQIGDRKPYTLLGASYAKAEGSNKATVITDPTLAAAATKAGTNTQNDDDLYDMTNKELDIGIKISEIDSVIDSDTSHEFVSDFSGDGKLVANRNRYIGLSQVKSRLQDSRALAWSTYRAPSLQIHVRNTTAKLDGKYHDNLLGDKSLVHKEPPGKSRLDPITVQAFEDALDGEYMPFYFQDLRTNEIIGLHAFLTSLTDDYSANYESTSGLGRAEPIRIYKDTQRKIGLSFMIAALDEKDFDHMWDKVNRLTMLVYPQYTTGKSYDNGTGIKFEKPFTQQVGASPMVRLRLGNLLRSNYSKFNLAKIFGINSDNVNVAISADDAKAAVTAAKTAAYSTAFAAVRATLSKNESRKYIPSYEFIVKEPGVYRTKLDKAAAARVDNDDVSDTTNKFSVLPKFDVPKKPQPNFVETGDWFNVTAADASNKSLKFVIDKLYTQAGKPVFAYGKIVQVTSNANFDKNVFVPIAAIEMTADTRNKYDYQLTADALTDPAVEAASAAAGSTSPAVSTIESFMDARNNVIVKSFESTGGKGLAGFIESMNFDWYDRTTWDIDIDRKAPKMCKVTISFAPIHDLSPGLDVHGNNRAPIYPLGPYAYGTRK